MLQIPGLFIAESAARGRGVFVAAAIKKGSLIEICPILVIPSEQVGAIHKTIFHDYYFLLPDTDGAACIPLGNGCLYNHSKVPNANVVLDAVFDQLEIHCIKDIPAGTEIFIDYNGNDRVGDALWFEVV